MARKHEQIAETLNATGPFPWHGVARCSDGSAVLVLPFLRATWELDQHNQRLERARKIVGRDAFIAGHFQDRWVRVLAVINKLTQLETIILRDNHDFEYIAAHRELPLWLDLFHLYVPILLDATVVALGLLLSDAPSSFPRQFKGLFRKGVNLEGMRLRCAENDFLEMLSRNREWHDQIRPNQGKSTRDSIVHRLSRWQVTTRRDLDESPASVLNAQFQGDDSDISSEDGLVEAGRILAGFCSFLSSLPGEVWISNAFEGRDMKTADDARCIGGRFLPMLPNVIQIRE